MLTQLDLFPRGWIELNVERLPRLVSQAWAAGRCGQLLLIMVPAQTHKQQHRIPKQLALDLQLPRPPVVRLVPVTRSAFLGMRSTSFFRRSPALHRLSMRYRQMGVIFLGDFLRLPTDEILAALKSAETLRMLEDELARVGLMLGDRFPWWRRPVPY